MWPYSVATSFPQSGGPKRERAREKHSISMTSPVESLPPPPRHAVCEGTAHRVSSQRQGRQGPSYSLLTISLMRILKLRQASSLPGVTQLD